MRTTKRAARYHTLRGKETQPLSGTYELSVGATKDTRRARPACKLA